MDKFEINVIPFVLLFTTPVQLEKTPEGFRSLKTGLEFSVRESLKTKVLFLIFPVVLLLGFGISAVKCVLYGSEFLLPVLFGLLGLVHVEFSDDDFKLKVYWASVFVLLTGFFLAFREFSVAFTVSFAASFVARRVWEYARRPTYQIIPKGEKKPVAGYCLVVATAT